MRTRCTFKKTERLHSDKLIRQLFQGGSRSMASFPIRIVFRPLPDGGDNQVLVSVSKHSFIRANKRNRVKRQIREAYRKHKEILAGRGLMMALLWLDNKVYPSEDVEKRVVTLLNWVKERQERS